MNKELIKKYKTEFNHYIDGGSILARKLPPGGVRTVWYEVDECALPAWKADYLFSLTNEEIEAYSIQFVINDEYVEFRKALVEGKQVQIWDAIDNRWRASQSLTPSSKFTQPIGDYGIKPKPTIKVGDWVEVKGPAGTYIECVSGVNDNTYTLSGTNICYKSQATLWKPKVGDWCIVDNSDNEDEHHSFTVHKWQSNSTPYTGPIPHFIKD